MLTRSYCAALLVLAANLCQASNILEFQGRAYDAKTEQFIYVENHRVTVDDDGQYLSSVVEYLNPQGELFATKAVSYRSSSTAPSFTFHDFRDDTNLSVNSRSESMSLTTQNGSSSNVEEVSLVADNQVVVDAGFDRFIYDNWEKLLEDREVSFAFLAISRARLVTLDVIEKSRSAESILYTVQPSNFFLRLLVDPIELTYNRTTQRLMRFEGVTNITKSTDGKMQSENYVAVIKYEY